MFFLFSFFLETAKESRQFFCVPSSSPGEPAAPPLLLLRDLGSLRAAACRPPRADPRRPRAARNRSRSSGGGGRALGAAAAVAAAPAAAALSAPPLLLPLRKQSILLHRARQPLEAALCHRRGEFFRRRRCCVGGGGSDEGDSFAALRRRLLLNLFLHFLLRSKVGLDRRPIPGVLRAQKPVPVREVEREVRKGEAVVHVVVADRVERGPGPLGGLLGRGESRGRRGNVSSMMMPRAALVFR